VSCAISSKNAFPASFQIEFFSTNIDMDLISEIRISKGPLFASGHVILSFVIENVLLVFDCNVEEERQCDIVVPSYLFISKEY